MPPGYPGNRSELVGYGCAVDAVGGPKVGPVGQQPRSDEADGVVEYRMGSVEGNRLTRVTLIADPHIPVVVVAALLGTLGQTHRRGGHHASARTGHAAQHRIGMPRVSGRGARGERGKCFSHAFSVADHSASGWGNGSAPERSDTSTTTSWWPLCASLTSQRRAVTAATSSVTSACDAVHRDAQWAAYGVPTTAVVPNQFVHAVLPESSGGRECDCRTGIAAYGDEPAHQYGTVGSPG